VSDLGGMIRPVCQTDSEVSLSIENLVARRQPDAQHLAFSPILLSTDSPLLKKVTFTLETDKARSIHWKDSWHGRAWVGAEPPQVGNTSRQRTQHTGPLATSSDIHTNYPDWQGSSDKLYFKLYCIIDDLMDTTTSLLQLFLDCFHYSQVRSE